MSVTTSNQLRRMWLVIGIGWECDSMHSSNIMKTPWQRSRTSRVTHFSPNGVRVRKDRYTYKQQLLMGCVKLASLHVRTRYPWKSAHRDRQTGLILIPQPMTKGVKINPFLFDLNNFWSKWNQKVNCSGYHATSGTSILFTTNMKG